MQSTHDTLATGQLRGAERVNLGTFLSRAKTEVSEAIHIKWDRESRAIALFRSIGEAGEGDWIRTDIEARVTLSGRGPDGATGYYLNHNDAKTVMTFLDRLRVERSDPSISIRYWSENNSQMLEESKFNNESLILSYETESGRENTVQVDHLFRSEMQRRGKFN